MESIASVEGVGYIIISKAIRITPATPSVVAQPLHGIAANGGRQAALVVFQGVVHGDLKELIHIFTI